MTEEPPQGAENSCSLCGAEYHEGPDDTAWMGLTCPGENGVPAEQDDFREALAAKYVEEVVAQDKAREELEDEADTLKEVWSSRTRNPEATPEVIEADVKERTDEEVNRQKLAGVFQEPELDIDVPHLTVPGKVPEHSGITTAERPRAKGFQESDYLMFTQGDTEVPDNG